MDQGGTDYRSWVTDMCLLQYVKKEEVLTLPLFFLIFFLDCINISFVECLRQYDTQQKGKTMSINLKNKQEIVEKFGANAKDTGSAEVQIAMLTKKIAELTEHMKSNKKDFATKRGLLMMVGKRKRLLSYLKSKDLEGYRSLVKKLNIRG